MKQRQRAKRSTSPSNNESKFVVPRAALVDKLRLLNMALATQPVVQIFQHYVFDGKTVSAYNDSIAIVARCEAGPFALHGPTLLGLLESSAGDDVGFLPEGSHVTIKTGRSTFKLPFLDEESFLFEEPTGKMTKVASLSEKLLIGFEAALITTTDDLARPALMGVCLFSNKEQTTLYSCDGDGMTRVPLGKGSGDLNLMMPNKFCEAVLKVMADTDAETGDLYASDEWVRASFNNGYEVFGRLIEVDTPIDYEDLVTQTLKKAKPRYIKVPQGMDDALVRAQVITRYETAPTLLTVEGNPSRIKLRTENVAGTVRDSFQFQGHPEVEARVSAELTGRAIKLCPEMAVHANCVAYRDPETGLFVLVSNMDG